MLLFLSTYCNILTESTTLRLITERRAVISTAFTSLRPLSSVCRVFKRCVAGCNSSPNQLPPPLSCWICAAYPFTIRPLLSSRPIDFCSSIRPTPRYWPEPRYIIQNGQDLAQSRCDFRICCLSVSCSIWSLQGLCHLDRRGPGRVREDSDGL
jgi:hypothetical protein